jgi:1-acyl-sn-glycerol-3-phosphate acyltransferase
MLLQVLPYSYYYQNQIRELNMYNQLNLTCIPMALNTGLCWGPKEWAKRPGHIVFEFLEPIPPGLNRRSFMAKLEETIEAGSNRLMIEGQTPA